MPEWLPLNLNDLTVVGVLVGVALLVITNRLVWHTRLKEVQARADKWEQRYVEAAALAASSVRAAEVTNEVLSRLPDHTQGRGADT